MIQPPNHSFHAITIDQCMATLGQIDPLRQ